MQNQSHYDPSRKTVGAIYRDAALNNTDTHITNGDLTNELMSSLVEDLNDTCSSKPFGEKPFYICVHEKKDLQMPRAILRRMITTLYRPYPEDDTLVFWVDPISNMIKFCWCLPHWSEMDNVLMNPDLYEKEYVIEIKAWKNLDLYHFGFVKNEEGNWMSNPNWKDKEMKRRSPIISGTLVI